MHGSIRSRNIRNRSMLALGMGNTFISGIYVTVLNRDVGESVFIREFARFGEITKVG